MMQAVKIENVIRKGSSTPIIAVDENGTPWFVKSKGAGDGLTALISDWIVTSIGNKLNLPILKPEVILIDESAQINYPHQEVSELIKRSYGQNLAYKFFTNAHPYHTEDPHPDFDKQTKDLIFLFDSFFVNVDRTKENPNIFHSKSEIYAADFGASFLIKEIFDNIPYCLNPEIQKLLKRNIFYNENLTAEPLLRKFKSLSKEEIHSIVISFPDEWISGSRLSKRDLFSQLYSMMYEKNHLSKALESLKKIEVPTDEELKQQRLANKKKFEENVFKNVVPLMPESKRY